MRIGKPESKEKGFVRFEDIGIGCCFRSYNNPFVTLFSGCFPIREVAHNIIVSPSSGIIRRLISIS